MRHLLHPLRACPPTRETPTKLDTSRVAHRSTRQSSRRPQARATRRGWASTSWPQSARAQPNGAHLQWRQSVAARHPIKSHTVVNDANVERDALCRKINQVHHFHAHRRRIRRHARPLGRLTLALVENSMSAGCCARQKQRETRTRKWICVAAAMPFGYDWASSTASARWSDDPGNGRCVAKAGLNSDNCLVDMAGNAANGREDRKHERYKHKGRFSGE